VPSVLAAVEGLLEGGGGGEGGVRDSSSPSSIWYTIVSALLIYNKLNIAFKHGKYTSTCMQLTLF